MESQQLVTIIPWTFIAQILNLFIQVYLIKRFLFKPINEVLKKRQEAADKDIQEAKKAKEAAEAVKTEYETSMSDARGEANRIIEDAKKDANLRAEELIKEAEQHASSIKAKAEEDIRLERKKALNEVKDEIGSIAMDIAGKVVEKEIHEDEHKALIDEFLQNVEEASLISHPACTGKVFTT